MATVETKPHVLIIDDEIDICYLLKGILKYKNIEADYVTSLEEADILLRNHNPPIIFLDNHLSDGYGVNQVRRIKRANPATIIIMITAHDTASDRQLAYNEGVDYFISKPFTRDIILQTMDKVCR